MAWRSLKDDEGLNEALDTFVYGLSLGNEKNASRSYALTVGSDSVPASSDNSFYTVTGNSINGSYIAVAGAGSAGTPSSLSTVVPVTSGGITINVIFDAAAMAAPASFRAGVQQAVAILAANISDKITVNINVDYSGTGGGAAAGPDNGTYQSYSSVRSMLISHASSGDAIFNNLPTGTAIQGQSNVAVWNAQLKLWGLLNAQDITTDDGSATFATDISPSLLVGVALHELTHALGRVPFGSTPDVFDLFRFTSPGNRLFSGAATAQAAYFSIDGGNTKIAQYGQNSDPSDFLNSGVQGSNDPFNEIYSSNTVQGLTTVDLKQLDALGFHLAINNPTIIESHGITSLVQIGSTFYMDATGTSSGPPLNYQGASVTTATFAGWSPVAAEQTSSGYDVVWKNASTGQYNIWTTDANGNYTGSLLNLVDGNSAALQSFEPMFHQDLNGDGVIGVLSHSALGSSSSETFHANFTLQSVTGNGGHDQIIFDGSSTAYSIVTSNSNIMVTDSVANRDGVEQFTGVEFLTFTDKTVFIENQNTANIARLYSAAFNRAPDLTGLTYWEDVYANNVPASAKSAGYYSALAQANDGSGSSIAHGFITSSEFQNLYGTLSDQSFVTQLYQNVLGRAPDQAGLNFWVGQLEGGGQTREIILVGLAESPENVAKTSAWLITV